MLGASQSAGVSVELIKVVLGGFVGVQRLIQVLLPGAKTQTQ